MIEIRITKEISDYEPKLLGPLTLRQSACVAAGAPLCYIIIRYLGPILTTEVAMFFCFIPAGIAYAFGWARPYGMKMEQFLRSVFVNRFLAPSHRRYKCQNVHEVVIADAEKTWLAQKEAALSPSERRRCQKEKQQAEKRQARYKVSPRAIR